MSTKKIADGITQEILMNGLKHSTWSEHFPEAYKELLFYAEDISGSIQDKLSEATLGDLCSN